MTLYTVWVELLNKTVLLGVFSSESLAKSALDRFLEDKGYICADIKEFILDEEEVLKV